MSVKNYYFPSAIGFRLLLVAVFLVALAGASATTAATFTVDTSQDGNGIVAVCSAAPDDCSLRGAITVAAATPGDDTVVFAPRVTDIRLSFGEVILNAGLGRLIVNGPGAIVLTVRGDGLQRLFSFNQSIITLTNMTVTGGRGYGANFSGNGGAIFASGGTLVLDRVNILASTAPNTGNGGGVWVNEGTNLQLINSTLSGNHADGACGGFANVGGTVTVIDTTISGNSTGGSGGGFCTSNGSTRLVNVTITGNTARQGGGIIQYGPLELGNTIVAGNTGTDNFPEICSQVGTLTSLGFNLVGDTAGDAANTSTPIPYQKSDLLDRPPLLAPLGNYGGGTFTHPLFYDSPAVNAGSGVIPGGTPLFDQRGAGRQSALDIGAYEVQPAFISPLANGVAGDPYVQILVPNRGTTTYALTDGELPPGVTLSVDTAPGTIVGLIGTPAAEGIYWFVITGTNGSNTEYAHYRIVVSATQYTTVSGRVLRPDGTGARNALVYLDDYQGNVRVAVTNFLGNFYFDQVLTGTLYLVTASAKGGRYAQHPVFITGLMKPIEFASLP
jgi:hypothetical protein